MHAWMIAIPFMIGGIICMGLILWLFDRIEKERGGKGLDE